MFNKQHKMSNGMYLLFDIGGTKTSKGLCVGERD